MEMIVQFEEKSHVEMDVHQINVFDEHIEISLLEIDL
jgi:hypothetical protein